MKLLKIIMLCPLLCYCCQSFAILPLVYDPYDVIQNTITAKNSVESLLNQAKQLQFEITNLKKLSPSQFENISNILKQLANKASEGNSLSYGINNIDEEFKKRFPGFSVSNDYNQDFTNWSTVTRDTLKNSLSAFAIQGKLFDDEDKALKQLQAQSEGVEGNVEAHQTSHRILLQQVGQMQKLRQLLLNQASAQNTFMAYQLQKEQSQQVALHEWIKNSQISFKRYEGNSGFGVQELPSLP